jgi:DNA-binding NarL/FixJ family response regulator
MRYFYCVHRIRFTIADRKSRPRLRTLWLQNHKKCIVMIAKFIAPVRILVADNHRILRIGLQVMLQEMGSRQQFEVEEAETAEEAITKVLAGNFHVVLMDYHLGGRGGPKATELMVARRPEISILGWSYDAKRVYAEQMMKAGAKGYLLKNIEQDTLLSAIRTVMEGGQFYSNEIAQRLLEPVIVQPVEEKMRSLSRRERQVFRLVLEGFQSPEIAEQLNIARRTVDKHKEHIVTKLGVRNSLGLVHAGLRMGLVALPLI